MPDVLLNDDPYIQGLKAQGVDAPQKFRTETGSTYYSYTGPRPQIAPAAPSDATGVVAPTEPEPEPEEEAAGAEDFKETLQEAGILPEGDAGDTSGPPAGTHSPSLDEFISHLGMLSKGIPATMALGFIDELSKAQFGPVVGASDRTDRFAKGTPSEEYNKYEQDRHDAIDAMQEAANKSESEKFGGEDAGIGPGAGSSSSSAASGHAMGAKGDVDEGGGEDDAGVGTGAGPTGLGLDTSQTDPQGGEGPGGGGAGAAGSGGSGAGGVGDGGNTAGPGGPGMGGLQQGGLVNPQLPPDTQQVPVKGTGETRTLHPDEAVLPGDVAKFLGEEGVAKVIEQARAKMQKLAQARQQATQNPQAQPPANSGPAAPQSAPQAPAAAPPASVQAQPTTTGTVVT
tara:strand:- start:4200 stop:5393 length:1194 start_codon:yes stop_codon:yes gene_type:complete